MKQRTWVIYKHTLIEDCEHYGWSYIGQTSTPTKVRWKSGYGYAKNCQVFRNAIDKHGWDNFAHEIIEEGIQSVEEANEREKYWIAYYHTFIRDPECRGYNMTPGGGAHDMVRQTIKKDGEVLKVFKSELPRFEAEGWRVLSKKEVSKLYYETHKDEYKEYYREYGIKYRAEHKEELRSKKQQYIVEHKEEIKARQKNWMDNNVEHIKAQKAAWREAHKEEQKEKHQQYYLANRDKIIQRASARQQEKKDEVAAYKKAYRQGYRKRNKVEEQVK